MIKVLERLLLDHLHQNLFSPESASLINFHSHKLEDLYVLKTLFILNFEDI